MEKPHKRLKAWQKAVELSIAIYAVTAKFPKEEIFGLTSQLRRAAVSIPSNIAEGAARSSEKEAAQFYNIARGSLSELDTQIEISHRLGYVNVDTFASLDVIMQEIDKALHGLWKKASQ